MEDRLRPDLHEGRMRVPLLARSESHPERRRGRLVVVESSARVDRSWLPASSRPDGYDTRA